MEAVKGLFSPLGLNTSSLQDTLKLVVVGGTVETARRASISAWNGFVDSFYLTAHFSQEDHPYDWLLHWLSKQPEWSRCREYEITTRSVRHHRSNQPTIGELDGEEIDGDEHASEHDCRRQKATFMPSLDTTHTILYHGHWLKITRIRRYQDYGRYSALKVGVVARDKDILKRLVLEAKREYEKDAEHHVHVFMADTTYARWKWNGTRKKRPMSSMVLEQATKILEDCQDFLHSEDWYAERGLPYRRGYLLHGTPGSGKTSLAYSIASELGLDIYAVTLSKETSEKTITILVENIPSQCILLLEDLDAACSTLTQSGLLDRLNAIAPENGLLLFATTNHIERIDPALNISGRMDVWVDFPNATKWQAEGIFKRFFPAGPPASSINASRRGIRASGRKLSVSAVPVLEEAEVGRLAKRFADAIPEGKISVASLQKYLLEYKMRPRESVEKVAEWVRREHKAPTQIKHRKSERAKKR